MRAKIIQKSTLISTEAKKKIDGEEEEETSLPLIDADVEIYQEGDFDNQVWFIMRRNTGDVFEFRKLFEYIV